MSDRYNDPDTGIAEFNGKLADVFDALEIDVEYRGDADDRDDYTPRSGAKFFALDTGDLYIGDGSSWGFTANLTLEPGDVNSSNWDDYEIQKNGTDGEGIINFVTEP